MGCHTDDENVKIGPVEVVFPIDIKDGPSYKILIKANVVTPEVSISSEKLDFGRVLIGHCKVFIYFILVKHSRLLLLNSKMFEMFLVFGLVYPILQNHTKTIQHLLYFQIKYDSTN